MDQDTILEMSHKEGEYEGFTYADNNGGVVPCDMAAVAGAASDDWL